MEGREPMGLGGPPGSFSSILQRGVGSPPVQQPPPLHAPAALRPSAISIASNPSNPSNANPNPVSVSADSSIAAAAAAGASALPSHMGMPMIRAEPLKRKRGRPRKYGPDGSMALALAPMSSSSTPGAFSPLQKRGRGRPPGSGRRQQLAALGEWLSGSAGVGFAPHVITIAAGEDVATKIMSFSQQGPRAVCILSANGAISNATLRQPATSGGTVTYEGRFEILSLSGSFLLTENGGTRSRTGGLSISLAGPDGRVIGGGVAGMLMAASPVQVIVGSFISNGRKNQPKQSNPEVPVSRPSAGVFPAGPSGAMPISRAPPNDNSGNKSSGPGSPPPTQNPGMQLSVPPQQLQNMPPYASMGWQSSHSTNDLRRNTDINIPLPGG